MACLPCWLLALRRLEVDRDCLLALRQGMLLAVEEVTAPGAQLAGQVGEVLRADQVRRVGGGALAGVVVQAPGGISEQAAEPVGVRAVQPGRHVGADGGVLRVVLPADEPLVERPELSTEPLAGREVPRVLVDLEAKHRGALDDRLCVGGPVTLLAAARPGTRHGQREPDYVLLVQERSARVLNVTGGLAVVPKAFHGPTTEAAEEAHLSASLERELEEEVLGREDLEQVSERSLRGVDPFAADQLSEPMRWLASIPGSPR
jgi:hypothetical protein